MPSQDSTARKGKIARMPASIREEVCQRLHDGQTAPEIVAWMNPLPEVQEILRRHFRGEPVSEKNISNWREGGFEDWKNDVAEAELLERQAELAIRLVKATGLTISDGAAAIAAGNILTQLQGANGEQSDELISQLVSLRSGDHSVADGKRKDRKLDLETDKAAMKKRELDLQEAKFRRLLIEKLIETAATPEVQRILTGGQPKAVQMDLLHDLLFGKPPEEEEP